MGFNAWIRVFALVLIVCGCAVVRADVLAVEAPAAAGGTVPDAKLAGIAPSSVVAPTGIDVKRPLFGGACKACPWGILASVTKEALKGAGYDVQICWVCWSSYGPREMADRTKPVWPAEAENIPKAYLELPPDAVPDISGTSEINLSAAWNGVGPATGRGSADPDRHALSPRDLCPRRCP
jgi:hypothetical protein